MSSRRRIGVMVALVGLVTLVACAPPNGVSRGGSTALDDAATEPGSKPLPPDDRVTIDTLDNGLTYYVRPNRSPGGSVEMRLVVRAGSTQEEPDQSGVAHFLEHMMFNGTEKYPKNELVATLQAFGSEFGPDINAYTDFDETVYELSLPTDDAEVVSEGLDVLHQWLTAATLSETDVTEERGVVLDEWRQSQEGLDGRVADAAEHMLLDGTPWEGRDPIGSDAAISSMSSDLVRRFYERWYQPDNVAVVVVGDIRTDRIVEQIRDLFADATNPADVEVAEPPSFAGVEGPRVSITADPDAVDESVELALPLAATTWTTADGLRDLIVDSVAFEIIANRMADDESSGSTPYTTAVTSAQAFVRGIDAPSIYLAAKPGRSAESLQAVADEFERIRRFGVFDSEVDRVVSSLRAEADGDYDGRQSRQDVEFAGDYVEHFLSGAPVPDAELLHDTMLSVLESITADDVQGALVRRWSASAPAVQLVGPADADPALPSAADVLAVLAGLPDRPLEQRADRGPVSTTLMERVPDPVTETSRVELDGEPGWRYEPTVLEFSNGISVGLNMTDIEQGQVYVSARSPGGSSLVADEDVMDALWMSAVAGASGLGALDRAQIDGFLADKDVNVGTWLDTTSEHVDAGCATDALEVCLQIVHLLITEPRFDQTAFDDLVSQLGPYSRDPSSDPDLAGQVAYTDARYDGERRMAAIPTPAELEALDIPTMQRVWTERFTDAGDWDFAIVGDFDIDEATDLARTYLGTLPGPNPAETWRDVEGDLPRGVTTKVVNAGTGEQASISLTYVGPSDGGTADMALAEVLTQLVTNRLTTVIREQLGQSYSPSSTTSLYLEPDVIVETNILVTGAPDEIASIADAVQRELADLRAGGATSEERDAAFTKVRRDYGYIDNGVLASTLLESMADPSYDAQAVLNAGEVFDELGDDELDEFVARALPADTYLDLRVLPA